MHDPHLNTLALGMDLTGGSVMWGFISWILVGSCWDGSNLFKGYMRYISGIHVLGYIRDVQYCAIYPCLLDSLLDLVMMNSK